MVNKLFKFLILSVSLIHLPVALVASESKPKYSKKTADEIRKKYGVYWPKETLILNDFLPTGDRVDLDNEYFKVSYPKCFEAEPTVEDGEDVTVKKSTSIIVIRTKSCPNFNQNLDLNIATVELRNLGYTDPEKIEIYERVSMAVYRQFLTVNGNKAVSVLGLGSSRRPERMFAPELYWNVYIGCIGKTKEMFRIGLQYLIGEDVAPYLEKKNFELPPDIKQIVSSFQCRKDR